MLWCDNNKTQIGGKKSLSQWRILSLVLHFKRLIMNQSIEENVSIPVTCSWARTPEACAEGRCRSLWKVSGAGSLLPAARSGSEAGRYLAAPTCHGLDALLCWGPGSRRLATSWGGVCRSKPVSVTSKPTVQIPLSTEGQRRDSQRYPKHSVSINISQLWK